MACRRKWRAGGGIPSRGRSQQSGEPGYEAVIRGRAEVGERERRRARSAMPGRACATYGRTERPAGLSRELARWRVRWILLCVVFSSGQTAGEGALVRGAWSLAVMPGSCAASQSCARPSVPPPARCLCLCSTPNMPVSDTHFDGRDRCTPRNWPPQRQQHRRRFLHRPVATTSLPGAGPQSQAGAGK
ncbi:hypothetical protein B0J12DRAFT_198979 [Macrophomina phaseolina]|uniref:Uncharacterized protein n=1 Tax=Macrophomina phaseolina TaxID=35725 RepID=A0ABQ8G370_9PEZI|nr:hypothetical protein B0J12DRAFT_198979 [Macrophomina phaseolina]